MGIDSIKKIILTIQKTLGLDLAIVLVLATILMLSALTLPDGNVLRIVFGLPFIMFLPGYSLVSTLWPKKSELDGLERFALSLGLSIALVSLAGLGLNYTPWGITLISVVVCLYCLILLMVVIVWLRRSKLPTEERFTLSLDPIFDKLEPLSYTDKLMVIFVAIAVVIGGSILFYIAMNPPREQYTEFYLLDENRTTENYPKNLNVNENATIVIVVVCHEQQATDYTASARLLSESEGNRTIAEYDFSLTDGEKWSQFLNFTINASGRFKLEVALFKGTDVTAYATTHIWIEVEY